LIKQSSGGEHRIHLTFGKNENGLVIFAAHYMKHNLLTRSTLRWITLSPASRKEGKKRK
jgi:hypothetical protein